MIHGRRRTAVTQRMFGEGAAEFRADGRPPCVVAFHGFTGTAAELRPLLERVAGDGYAVDGALLPGHGTSPERLQGMSFDDWVEAARARARAAAAEHGRFVLLGFSLGSLLAMQVAGERPEGLAGLVVLGNALTLRPASSVPLAIVGALGVAVPDVYVVKPRPGDLADPSAMAQLVTYDRHPLRAALEVYRAGARVRRAVGQIECPMLILHGVLDGVCSWRNATWLADHAGSRDVALRLFERSAHVLACDAEREEVAREVLSFLAKLG